LKSIEKKLTSDLIMAFFIKSNLKEIFKFGIARFFLQVSVLRMYIPKKKLIKLPRCFENLKIRILSKLLRIVNFRWVVTKEAPTNSI
jgi:hypothetical protein